MARPRLWPQRIVRFDRESLQAVAGAPAGADVLVESSGSGDLLIANRERCTNLLTSLDWAELAASAFLSTSMVTLPP